MSAERHESYIPTLEYDLRLCSLPGGNGWRVTVLLDGRMIATATENSPYAAAVVGIDLYGRVMAARAE